MPGRKEERKKKLATARGKSKSKTRVYAGTKGGVRHQVQDFWRLHTLPLYRLGGLSPRERNLKHWAVVRAQNKVSTSSEDLHEEGQCKKQKKRMRSKIESGGNDENAEM